MRRTRSDDKRFVNATAVAAEWTSGADLLAGGQHCAEVANTYIRPIVHGIAGISAKALPLYILVRSVIGPDPKHRGQPNFDV
jgi:hypothetical protein